MNSRRLTYRFSVFAFALAIAAASLGASTPAMAQAERHVLTDLVNASTLTKVTKSGELRVGWNTFYPFLFKDPKTNKVSGITVDIYEKHLGPALGVKIVWIEQPWSTMIAGLQSDRFDVVANANRTYSRLLAAEFAGPMAQSGKALGVLKANAGKYTKWQDANNAATKVCVALGTSADTDTTKFLKTASITRLEGDPACIQSLVSGRADIFAWDVGSLYELQKKNPDIVIVPDSTFTKSEVGIYVKQGDQITLNWINQFIREMKIQGVLADLIAQYEVKGYSVPD